MSTTTTLLPLPISWLKFEDTAGSVAFDSSMHNNY
jgi:hypothetical protein